MSEISPKYLPPKLTKISQVIIELNKVKKNFIPQSELKTTFENLFGSDSLQSELYELGRSIVPAFFTVKDPDFVQNRLQGCIAGLNRAWNDMNTKSKKLIDTNAEYQFRVILGALSELHSLVNTWSQSINLESKDSTQLIKIFSGIDTFLAYLYAIEASNEPEEQEKEKENIDFWSTFETLTDDQKQTFITTNWNPSFTTNLDKNIAKKTLEYLIISPDIEISEFDLAKLFDKGSQERRLGFLRNISKRLTSKEILLLEATMNEN